MIQFLFTNLFYKFFSCCVKRYLQFSSSIWNKLLAHMWITFLIFKIHNNFIWQSLHYSSLKLPSSNSAIMIFFVHICIFVMLAMLALVHTWCWTSNYPQVSSLPEVDTPQPKLQAQLDRGQFWILMPDVSAERGQAWPDCPGQHT